MAERACRLLQQLQIELGGIAAAEGVGQVFLGGEARGRHPLAHAEFHGSVVATFDQLDRVTGTLVASGVASERVVPLHWSIARRRSPGHARLPLSPTSASEAGATEQ